MRGRFFISVALGRFMMENGCALTDSGKIQKDIFLRSVVSAANITT